MKRRILAMLLCLGILLCSVPTVLAVDTGTGIAVESRYRRTALAGLPNGGNLVKAYDALREGAAVQAEQIDLSECPITRDELPTVLDAFRNDTPECFWLSNRMPYAYDGDTVLLLAPIYVFSGDALTAAQAALETAIDEMLGSLSGLTDAQIALELHDRLAKRITYIEVDNAHDAYGALVNGRAVCEGYARAYQLLLNRCGIPCLTVTGTGGGVGHAWNMFRLGGSWVQTDVTWDDQGSALFHYYYACTDDQILQDHQMDVLPYDLPVCNDDSYRYFTEDNSFMELQVEAVIALFAGGISDNRAECAIEYTGSEAVMTWLQQNLTEIAQSLQIQGSFSYGSQQLGKEYHLYIETETPIPTDCPTDNHIFLHGACVRCGELEVEAGDLNGDGTVNSLDGLLLMRYLNDWDVTVSNPQAMDVNADGEVNSLDGLLLMRYLNGWDVTLGTVA